MTTTSSLIVDPTAVGKYALIADQSAITFATKSMWGLMAVRGKFSAISGSGELTAQNQVTGQIVLAATSIDTENKKRDDHLRSADFFDVEKFPNVTVTILRLRPQDGDAAMVDASFTVKDVTRAEPLPVVVTMAGNTLKVTATLTIDKADFGLFKNPVGMMAKSVTLKADLSFLQS